LEGKTINGVISNLSLTMNVPYTISDSLSKEQTSIIDDLVSYILNIKNTDASASMDVILSMESELPIAYTDNIVRDGASFRTKDSLAAGVSKTYKLTGKVENIKNYLIKSNIDLKINDKSFYLSTNRTLKVSAPDIKPSITLNKALLKSGEKYIINISFNNTDPNNDYFFIYGLLKGTQDEYLSYSRINREETVIMARNYSVPQYSTNQTTVNFSFRGIYRTKNNQERSLYVEKSVPLMSGLTLQEDVKQGNITTTNASANTANAAVNTTSPDTGQSAQAPASSATTSDKDWLTRMFDGINKFFEKIFKRKN
jgi:hypothetical protein